MFQLGLKPLGQVKEIVQKQNSWLSRLSGLGNEGKGGIEYD